MTYIDLATQLKQIYITQSKFEIMNQILRKWLSGLFDVIKETYPNPIQPYPTGHDQKGPSLSLKIEYLTKGLILAWA